MTEGETGKAAGELTAQESLRAYEQHFNQLELNVRQMASVWILAIFSAVAFLVRGDLNPHSGLLEPMPLLGLIALFGNVGLLTLWFLDQHVYHRLLAAGYQLGLELERKDPEMMPIRNLMWVNSGGLGMGRFAALFYAAPMTVNALVGLFAALRELPAETPAGWLLAVSAVTAAVIPLWVAKQWIRKEATVPYSLADAETVVERWRQRG